MSVEARSLLLMPNLEILTRFGAVDLVSMDKDGRELLVVCVAGRFALPAGGQSFSQAPLRTDEQLPPPTSDAYWGEPGKSSLRVEGQNAYIRQGTDIYISGHAWAPRGRPVKEVLAAARVGPCQKGVRVFGDRVWARGLVGGRASEPRPFESMPLVYERSFGGAATAPEGEPARYEARNPVGRGYYRSTRDALDQPLPNLEEPSRLLSSPTDRVMPAGFGPIARGWQPRLGFGGTYGQAWVDERAPLWPLDFDVRFFNAAAPGLVSPTWLRGGEDVVLSGFSPDGRIAFPLPCHRLALKVVFRRRVVRRLMVLDAVHLDTDERTLTLVWRSAVPAHRELQEHVRSVVRELEPWEEVTS
ncbi:DUF2169 family type VI secretion system accessory protein [Pyxidicoccus xibeiensis]|uniref:DUF2169 family type VI secretion system accessory protein n=1 Tax=Pyxidicoccus xibeiensis TaxID=2906759 RepID=UPI0020A74650|nr:DUF2169 domain-containing protein [Pyxidicoccus xibeiensis]MCP3136629.1 DUF2169 domain-containing protein [Pyxidicoccus xibeiensis]